MSKTRSLQFRFSRSGEADADHDGKISAGNYTLREGAGRFQRCPDSTMLGDAGRWLLR